MVSFSFDKFMRGLASGSDSGLGSFAKPYVQGRTQDALNKGIGQIQEGDWNGGISTIGEWSPETAMSLAQYKQKQDDAMNMAQMKIAADIQNRNTLTPYQQEMLALKRQQLAQGGDANPFNSKNEFINLMGIRNNPKVWDSLPDDQKALINSRLSYMSNAPENLYDISYQKKAGSLQAEKEGKQLEALDVANAQTENINGLISDIEANKGLFGIYSPAKIGASRITKGKIGYTPEEMEKRGNMLRRLGEVQNSIIQKARAAGQVGINTLAEIEQATKGLNEISSDEEIVGALKAIRGSEQRLIERFNQQRGMQPQQSVSEGTVIEDANGNRLILRGGQWQQM